MFLMISVLLGVNSGFAQSPLREDEQEKTLNMLEGQKLQRETSQEKTTPTHRLSSSMSFFSGYDSNAKLSPDRQGDIFEEYLFSLDFIKYWPKDINFTFTYDFDMLNYNEFTDVSSILNHFRIEPSKKFAFCTLGTGYDLGILYYPHNKEGTFLLHKGFFYLSQDISKNTYHKLQFEAGYKTFTDGKALDEAIGSYQDKERKDKRKGLEYRISSLVHPKLRLSSRARFSINDSNARYVDFYDYKSYAETLRADYKLGGSLRLFADCTYIRKIYDSRTVTLRDYKEKDNLYGGNIGLTHKADKRNHLMLYYTYWQNVSNDDLARYTESMITCGWQHVF
jgi:hypothetical protein